MDVTYEISKEARIDVKRAICFFKLIGKEAQFLDDLADHLRLIRNIPKAFQVRYRSVRIVNLKNFNYSIHYFVKEKKIVILRVLNQKQDF